MQHRVLIVDDSVPLHDLIKAQMDEDFEYHSAFCGADAIEMAAELRPNLILLDVDMADMDGFEVCRHLKACVQTTNIPVIFLTADFVTCDKVKGLDLGGADYITKPFKLEELEARVRNALRAKEVLDQKAMVDGVTGLWNQKYLETHVAAQLASALRESRPVSYIALDVDGLRLINRKFGVAFGDEMLRNIGTTLLSQCRSEDAVCRCQGGKFGIVVSGMNRSGAAQLAERLCAQIANQTYTHGAKEVRVTCSFGVADSLVSGAIPVVERADLALLRAKQNGGNSVSVARPHRHRQIRAAA
jgi:diguanylate cyclase (GGDEF)-like protein